MSAKHSTISSIYKHDVMTRLCHDFICSDVYVQNGDSINKKNKREKQSLTEEGQQTTTLRFCLANVHTCIYH